MTHNYAIEIFSCRHVIDIFCYRDKIKGRLNPVDMIYPLLEKLSFGYNKEEVSGKVKGHAGYLSG